MCGLGGFVTRVSRDCELSGYGIGSRTGELVAFEAKTMVLSGAASLPRVALGLGPQILDDLVEFRVHRGPPYAAADHTVEANNTFSGTGILVYVGNCTTSKLVTRLRFP